MRKTNFCTYGQLDRYVHNGKFSLNSKLVAGSDSLISCCTIKDKKQNIQGLEFELGVMIRRMIEKYKDLTNEMYLVEMS